MRGGEAGEEGGVGTSGRRGVEDLAREVRGGDAGGSITASGPAPAGVDER